MTQFAPVLNAVLPVFVIAGSGFGMRKLNWLTQAADESLLRLTINVLIPCLAFDSLLGNPALRHAGNLILPPLVGFGTVALGLGVALIVSRWVPERHPATRRTFAYSTAIYNYGYIPLPLAVSLFDRRTVAVLFIHNVGVDIAFWTFGLLLLARVGLRSSWHKLLNVPLITIVTTVVLDRLIPRDAVPTFFLGAVHLLGECAVPMGIIIIGATVADQTREFTRAQGGRAMLLACLLRLGLLPLAFLTIGHLLPASVELKRVMVLQAAMPAAVLPIVIARHYGGDPVTALRVVVATSLVGFVTIPLWIRFGLHFLGV